MSPLRFALCGFIVIGCGCRREVKETPLQPFTTVGTMTQKEVNDLALRITAMRFPASETTFENIIPAGLEPDTWAIVEGFALKPDSAGRAGGRIRDFWLNHRFVLRVAESYRVREASQVEWAVIIPANERKTFKRPIYSDVAPPNILSEPSTASSRGSR